MSTTIILPPTRRGFLPLLLEGVENGTVEGRRLALEELGRMADAADSFNARANAVDCGETA